MVSTRSGNKVEDPTMATVPSKAKESTTSKKRKSQDASEEKKNYKKTLASGKTEKLSDVSSTKNNASGSKAIHPPNKKAKTSEVSHEDKENRPTTPAVTDNVSENNSRNERTPGRVGPIKPERFGVSPDIKPFKGPPGKKVRKTAWEKDQEYRKFALETEDHIFHELYVCFDKGPNGSPTYDKSGFQLDYDKVAHWMEPKPYNKNAMIRGMDNAVDKAQKEEARMAELFFVKGEAPEKSEFCSNSGYWRDRVSKDLNIPWHKTGVKEFEEWAKKGFPKARRGEYENPSEEERARMMRLLSGASLRK